MILVGTRLTTTLRVRSTVSGGVEFGLKDSEGFLNKPKVVYVERVYTDDTVVRSFHCYFRRVEFSRFVDKGSSFAP